MPPSEPFPNSPPGSDALAAWARPNGLVYVANPDEAWFRQWEPYDTIAPPSLYLNACTQTQNPGHITIVEPWYAPEGGEPLERSVLGFALHPALMRRAAARVGEHFLTRVAFLESSPPPTVKIGDALWDTHVITLAASPSEAAAAFHPRLRKLLAGWGFQGHIELRPGGAVVYFAGLRPTPSDYDRMRRIVREIVTVAITPR